MKQEQLAAHHHTHRVVTTHADPAATPAENVLDRAFQAQALNTKRVADVTYILPGWAGCILQRCLICILDALSAGQWQPSKTNSWAIGFLDEMWWSRFALPRLQAWQTTDEPVHLVEQSWQKADPDAKALACYGVLWQRGPADAPIRDPMSLRFVDGRPVSDITMQFLTWCCTQLEHQGKAAWLLIWDNASWHCSKIVRSWIREHNHQVKLAGKGVRILPLFLPKQSPWLNPIEPSGCMVSGPLLNPMRCFRLSNWLSAFVPTITVRLRLIYLSRIYPGKGLLRMH